VIRTCADVRPARPDDLAPHLALAFAERAEDVAVARPRFERDLAEPDRQLFVATVRGAFAGFGRVARFEPPPDAPANAAPAGVYLLGALVARRFRRRGIGRALTAARMAWALERSDAVWYFTNGRNQVSRRLHDNFGFVEVTRDFWFPRVKFAGDVGVLFRSTGATP
jgi:ribosomal protein S18 acetylase RimI-like enzyme